MNFFDEQPDGDIHGECALEIHRQQETIEALAEQNLLLREALEFLNSRVVTMELGGVVERALTLPDLSTSILNQRDARTLREAATRFTEEQHPGIWHKLKEMAAEKEKA